MAAGKLVDIGVKKGDHVGLLGVNTIEWLVCYYAIHKIGAIAVLLNYGYLEKELKDVVIMLMLLIWHLENQKREVIMEM